MLNPEEREALLKVGEELMAAREAVRKNQNRFELGESISNIGNALQSLYFKLGQDALDTYMGRPRAK